MKDHKANYALEANALHSSTLKCLPGLGFKFGELFLFYDCNISGNYLKDFFPLPKFNKIGVNP